MSGTLAFRRYDRAQAHDHRELVAGIYRDAYADRIATGDPFDAEEAFLDRFASYTRPENTSFDLVIAFLDEQPVGQAWGWPLTSASAWWRDLAYEPEPGFTDEDGTRTFALSMIMVCRDQTGHGIAHALHDELLGGRPEQRATLLVKPDNTTAYTAYKRWGWKKVSELRPGWPSAPLMDVLVLGLPLT